MQAGTKAYGGKECGESRIRTVRKDEVDSQPIPGPCPPYPNPHRELMPALTPQVSSQERALGLAQLMAASRTPALPHVFPLRDNKKKGTIG